MKTLLKQLSVLERMALRTLVDKYGPELIIKFVQDLGFDLAEKEHRDA